MSYLHDNHKFIQVIERFYSKCELLDVEELVGGVSAQVNVLEILHFDGIKQKLLIRQHGENDRTRNPHIARDEYNLLLALKKVGLPVPSPCYVDGSHEIFPIPYIIVEYIEGHTEFSPSNTDDCIQQLVSNLVKIHQVNLTEVDLSFLPSYQSIYAEKMSRQSRENSFTNLEVHSLLNTIAPEVRKNSDVLLHGDYWLGNILWRDGQLIGVIDWEDAMLGDPLVDLAKSRLEMLWSFGLARMEQFTETYQALMPQLDYTFLPYWDLRLAVRKGPDIEKWIDDEAKRQMMQEQCWVFITHAVESLKNLSL